MPMPFKEPFILGPFLVDAEGRLSPARRDVSPGFSIRWRGRIVHAHLLGKNDDDGQLVIQASLGRVPSTASDAQRRLTSLSLMRTMLGSIPDTWGMRLLPDHHSRVDVETTVGLPITVTSLVTELTLFLLKLSPYLDLLDEAGIGLVAEAGA